MTTVAMGVDAVLVRAAFEDFTVQISVEAGAVVLVKVLSPTTQRYDREEKAAHYRRIPSLASYVLISQEEQRVEVFTRNSDGSWTLREARSGAVELLAIGCSLTVADVYRNPLAST